MSRIGAIISRFKEVIVFTGLVLVSLIFISNGNLSQMGGFRTIVIGGIGWFERAFSWIPNPGALQSENRALRQLNLQLSTEVTRMRKAMIENERLREMIEFKKKSPNSLISSEVVGKTSIEMRNYITIDRGGADGIKKGMPVRTDAGLVGVVLGYSQNYSIIEVIRNRNVKISAVVQRTGYNGIVVWEEGEYFYLNNIPSSFDVQKGDVVLTSNYSNKYPVDIPIGEIVDVRNDPSTLFHKIYIKPFVNFNTISEVFVIQQVPDPERTRLIKQIENYLEDIEKQ